jgi:hypothetical protein
MTLFCCDGILLFHCDYSFLLISFHLVSYTSGCFHSDLFVRLLSDDGTVFYNVRPMTRDAGTQAGRSRWRDDAHFWRLFADAVTADVFHSPFIILLPHPSVVLCHLGCSNIRCTYGLTLPICCLAILLVAISATLYAIAFVNLFDEGRRCLIVTVTGKFGIR